MEAIPPGMATLERTAQHLRVSPRRLYTLTLQTKPGVQPDMTCMVGGRRAYSGASVATGAVARVGGMVTYSSQGAAARSSGR